MSRPSPTEISIRAYSEKPGRKPVGSKAPRTSSDSPSPWSIVFDCETTIDACQRLRFGFFQVRKNLVLEREGVFFDPSALSEAEAALLSVYCERQGLELLPIQAFRVEIFLKVAYDYRGTVVGFNLPFDISRIALRHGVARGSMRNGFTFALSDDPKAPNVRAKHLSARSALIDFAIPGKQETPRGMRNRGKKVKAHRGHFVDLKTLAAALTSQSFSLARLAKFLGTPTQKLSTDEHGGPLSEAYLDYARADVQASWECHERLILQYSDHGLGTEAHRIMSEASIGKAYLAQMGVEPLLRYQPDIPRAIFGTIMGTYYGGRAEVHIRRTVTRVLYCDFKSMYPTVCSLMGLWRFVIGSQLSWVDSTTETKAFLASIRRDHLQSPEAWKRLTTLVKIKPAHDLFPVRAQYDGKINTIGLNYISSDQQLWYTLADCIAAKLLTGKTPEIEAAISFDAGPPQANLNPIDLFGREDYRIDPLTDDLFRRLIDMRDEAKANKEEIEKAIKIVANSTSYGIFVEVNRDDAPKPEKLDVYGPNGEHHEIESTAIEEPGKYFHPSIGTLITGAARLMLALAEFGVKAEGLDWAFCDTDSIAMAKPDGMLEADFLERAGRVVDFFGPLNPYQKPGSILKIEDINFGLASRQIEPLYCFAISAKRYALFNLDIGGTPIIRKASAHGLGHLVAPYGDDDPHISTAEPSVSLKELGVKRWQYDLWFKIIEAALRGEPHKVRYDWHPALKDPAMSRYGATSPHLLKWVELWNQDRPYDEQIRPFGFMVSFMPRSGPFLEGIEVEVVDPTLRGRPKTTRAPKPVAPFDLSPGKAVLSAFDRETGEPIQQNQLKTYAEGVAQYHLSSEDKFLNGDFYDAGGTERRHIKADNVNLIGKEANKIGDSGEAHPLERYGVKSFRAASRLYSEQDAHVAHLSARHATRTAEAGGKSNHKANREGSA